MIVETFEQGSAAWHKARLGIPTASHFDDILTPKTRKVSSSADGYMLKLLAEWATGVPSDTDSSQFMDRGTALEPEAASWYAYERGVELQKVGIVLRDDRLVGASPDRLVGEDGLLEIKCPSAHVHVGRILNGMSGHLGQTQGALWLTGRKWIDLLSYSPVMPSVIVRYERDDEHIAALDEAVGEFVARMLRLREELIARGVKPARMLLKAGQATDDPF